MPTPSASNIAKKIVQNKLSFFFQSLLPSEWKCENSYSEQDYDCEDMPSDCEDMPSARKKPNRTGLDL